MMIALACLEVVFYNASVGHTYSGLGYRSLEYLSQCWLAPRPRRRLRRGFGRSQLGQLDPKQLGSSPQERTIRSEPADENHIASYSQPAAISGPQAFRLATRAHFHQFLGK